MAEEKEKLFEYAVLFHPTEDQRTKQGLKSKIIVDRQTTLAKDSAQAAMLAARAIPTEYAEKLDQVEVAVRAF